MKLIQCRLRIVDYFDDLVNDVNFRTEEAEWGLSEFDTERANKTREEIINRIRQVQEHNLANFDKTYKKEEFDELGETEIDRKLFNKFCFMIDRKRFSRLNTLEFGHFVVVDQFVSKDTLAAFRELLDNQWPYSSLVFKMEETEDMLFRMKSDVFKEDNLMMECTTRELFRLESVDITNAILESIKEPARELFENIQRVNYTIKSFSQEYIEAVRLIGRNADWVHLTCHDQEFESSTIAPLSDIKIKSLRLRLEPDSDESGFDSSITYDPVYCRLADLLLPLVHLEELELVSWTSEILTAEHREIKFDRLKKLSLNCLELDIELIEWFENLNELVLERVPKTAKAIMKNLKPMHQLQSVEICETSLHEIEAESFQGLQSITSLKLNDTFIFKIHENAFVHLKNLRRLELFYNWTEKLNSGALNGLTSLTSLNLPFSHIASIDENAFKDLRSLTSLDLSNNRLTTICQSISGLSQLKELNLHTNLIETLDGHIFEQLRELETLDLRQNRIKYVEPNVFQRLVKLQSLTLSHNQISSIEAGTFHGLSSLKSLNLSSNWMISSIETDAFRPMATTLEILFLEESQLQQFDSSLFHLQSLVELRLGFNRIEKLEPRGLENKRVQIKLIKCRLRVSNYFDSLVRDVDLRAEQTFAKWRLDRLQIEQVHQRRAEWTKEIRQVQDHNLAHLDKTYKEEEFEGLTETEIDIKLFNKFCIIIDAPVYYNHDVEWIFGHLVVVDRFVREDTLAAFRQLLQGQRARDFRENNLLFEMEKEGEIDIKSDVFRADNLIIECTTQELFRLACVQITNAIIKSIKEPARELFENIQRVEYDINAFTQEHIESVRLIGSHADHVHISSYDDNFDASIIDELSDIKIKSLYLTVSKLTKVTHDDDGSPVAQLYQLADLLLPLVHLEELYLVSWSDQDSILKHKEIKFARLKKLSLTRVEVDVEFIECCENLNELLLTTVPKTAKAIMKNLKPMQQIQNMEICDSSLHEIEAESFQGLQSMTSLRLQSNDINKIHENAFLHLNDLKRLDLGGNRLDELNASAFNGLTSITYLNLSTCCITSLDENAFKDFKSLTSLDLSDNKLTTIGQSIPELSRLNEQILKDSSIETLDDHLLEQLETLHLSQNRIKSVKPTVFQGLDQLQYLCLGGNQLSSIEAGAFHGLPCLYYLDLSHNMISSIEPTAFSHQDATLETLFLNGNQLQQIDSSLFHLHSLKELYLGSNRIEELELRRLENLTILDLSYNQISEISQDSFRWSTTRPSCLTYLNLSSNRITNIESIFFALYPKLEQLYLNYNQINELKKETFWCLESLLQLDLSFNKIEFLHPELFKSQRCLKTLSIGENALQAINCDTFSANLVSLEQLDLSYNRITSIQADSFAHLPRLHERNLRL